MLTAAAREALLQRARAVREQVGEHALLPLLDGVPGEDLLAEPQLGLFLVLGLRTAGRSAAAAALCEALEDPCRRRRDDALVRRQMVARAALHWDVGELTRAEDLYLQLLVSASDAGDDHVLGWVSSALGCIASIRGHFEQALTFGARAIAAQQRLGAPRWLADSYNNMAVTLRELGYYAEAEEQLQRAAAYARTARNEGALVVVDVERAFLAYLRGDTPLAAVLARRALEHAVSVGNPVWEGEARRVQAVVARAADRLDEARDLLLAGLACARRKPHPLLQAEIFEELGVLEQLAGDAAAARAAGNASVALFEALGSPARAARARARCAAPHHEARMAPEHERRTRA